jgi:hypothetical protein
MQKAAIDSNDLAEMLVIHCAEMGVLRENVEKVAKAVDRLTNFFMFVFCLNLSFGLLALIVVSIFT